MAAVGADRRRGLFSLTRQLRLSILRRAPRDGTDANLKIAFQRAILKMEGDRIVLETPNDSYDLPTDDDAPTMLRRSLDAAVRGDPPPVSVTDCYRAVRLIDLAYIAAGNPYGTAAI